jgi:hypothetical protein
MRFEKLIGKIRCNAYFDGPDATERVADAEVSLAVPIRCSTTWTLE